MDYKIDNKGQIPRLDANFTKWIDSDILENYDADMIQSNASMIIKDLCYSGSRCDYLERGVLLNHILSIGEIGGSDYARILNEASKGHINLNVVIRKMYYDKLIQYLVDRGDEIGMSHMIKFSTGVIKDTTALQVKFRLGSEEYERMFEYYKERVVGDLQSEMGSRISVDSKGGYLSPSVMDLDGCYNVEEFEFRVLKGVVVSPDLPHRVWSRSRRKHLVGEFIVQLLKKYDRQCGERRGQYNYPVVTNIKFHILLDSKKTVDSIISYVEAKIRRAFIKQVRVINDHKKIGGDSVSVEHEYTNQKVAMNRIDESIGDYSLTLGGSLNSLMHYNTSAFY